MNDENRNGPDAVTFLENQHAEIRRLFDELQRPGGDRGEVFGCLVRLLAVHETAEEMIVHPQLRNEPAGDAVVEQLLDEENRAKRMLADLEDMGVDDPRFEAEAATLRAAVLAHAEHEELHEFPLLRAVETPAMLQHMTEQLEIAESMAPTHPHPHGPDGALGNLLVGPFVSMADRVRDALRR
jgi:hypothetical protein